MKGIFLLIAVSTFSSAYADGLRAGTVTLLRGTVLHSKDGKTWASIKRSDVNHLDLRSGDQVAVHPGAHLEITRRGARTSYGPAAKHYEVKLVLTRKEQADLDLIAGIAHSAAKRKGTQRIIWPGPEEPASASEFQVFLGGISQPHCHARIETLVGDLIFDGTIERTPERGYSSHDLIERLRSHPGEDLILSVAEIQGTARFKTMDQEADDQLRKAIFQEPSDTIEGALGRVRRLLRAHQWALVVGYAREGGSIFDPIAKELAKAGYVSK